MPADVCIAVQEMRNNFTGSRFLSLLLFSDCTSNRFSDAHTGCRTNLMWKHGNSKKWSMHSWDIMALLWIGIKYRHLVHCQPMFCNLAAGCLASKSGLCKLCKLQWCIEMHSGPMNLKQACIHGRGGRWNNATTRRAISRLIPCQPILPHQPITLQATKDSSRPAQFPNWFLVQLPLWDLACLFWLILHQRVSGFPDYYGRRDLFFLSKCIHWEIISRLQR